MSLDSHVDLFYDRHLPWALQQLYLFVSLFRPLYA